MRTHLSSGPTWHIKVTIHSPSLPPFPQHDYSHYPDTTPPLSSLVTCALPTTPPPTNTGPQHMRCAIKLDAEFSAVACVEKEKDVVRLRAYHAVVYAQPVQLPYLGGGTYVRRIRAIVVLHTF